MTGLSQRRTWDEYQDRHPYPERSQPTVHDDGSWRGDGDRELSPALNAEVDRGSEFIREVGEKAISRRVAVSRAYDCLRVVGPLVVKQQVGTRLLESVFKEEPFSTQLVKLGNRS